MNTTITVDSMPDVVHEPYVFLLDETDVEPVVERSGYGKILLTHLGERTKMTIQFRLDGRKWRWEKSRLFVDGERVPNAGSWDMYVSVFKDPDNGRRNFVPKGAKKAKIPASKPVDEQYLPSSIAAVLKSMRKSVANDSNASVVPSITNDGKVYQITVTDNRDGGSVVLFFEYSSERGGSMDWGMTDALAVNASGYDVTRFLENGLEDHLMKILGAQSRDAQVPFIPSGVEQQAAANNSTMVRKSTVIRV